MTSFLPTFLESARAGRVRNKSNLCDICSFRTESFGGL